MGREPVFKRDKNPVYITCCILMGILLAGCQALSPFQSASSPADTVHGKHLVSVRELIQNKDFKGAARENERILEVYREKSNKPDRDDPVLTHYMQDAMILSDLLNRIIEDEKKIEGLYISDLINRDQLKVRTRMIQSLKKNLARLKKNLAETKVLNERIKALENENSNLLEQIDRLKAIDLDPA